MRDFCLYQDWILWSEAGVKARQGRKGTFCQSISLRSAVGYRGAVEGKNRKREREREKGDEFIWGFFIFG